MAPSHLQPRSSIDLGVDTRRENSSRLSPNPPPRLQHSPSLPNIRFPPYSTNETSNSEVREVLHRPLTPPSIIMGNAPSSDNPEPPSETLEHREPSSIHDFSALRTHKQPKKPRRRRADRDSGHLLLTPPLTPSSSLRTTASVDSAGTQDDNGMNDNLPTEGTDKRSTRFLLLSNVSESISAGDLRTSIADALMSTYIDPRIELKEAPLAVTSKNLADRAIKGVFVRYQQSSGIVIIAFWDVRDAEKAQRIVSISSSDPLAKCAGDEQREDGTNAQITCQFVTAQHLIKMIGNSTFLASSDATFYLIVEAERSMNYTQDRDVRVDNNRNTQKDDDSKEDTTDTNIEELERDCYIKLPVLQTFLRSFGDLREVNLVNNFQKRSKKVFHVEFYDIRAAQTAYENINGKVVFGMRLTVFGRDIAFPRSSRASHSSQPRSHDNTSQNTATLQTPAACPEELGPLGCPGQHSQMRERFLYVEDAEPGSRSTSPEQEVYHSTRQPSAPSPKYFYESMSLPSEAPSALPHLPKPPTIYGIQGTPPFITEPPMDVERNLGAEYPGDKASKIPHWQTETFQAPPAVFFGPPTECYYCPSRRSPNQASGHCYASTPSPFYHQVDPNLQVPPHSIPFPTYTPTPAPQRFTYEPEIHLPRPFNPTLPNWPLEQPIVIAPHPANSERWVYDPQVMLSPGMQGITYCAQQMPAALSPNAPYLASPNVPEAPSQAEQPQHRLHSPTGGRLHLRNRCSALHTGSGTREPTVPPERNQLNLARIEDGQDTRTTVMIKNIPNKMSDKDLIAYIGKVCPRRIDFLYLRMDFQNGCNVGYAFVNFITVQDLLHFAKKRLGEKWNMFSSEKVLQMSYANYQGKEALVEKFKNSCIMDEREAWRPKIFYSELGPEQGLPEPFPAPTHLRRKERSSFNRGALYVPGVNRVPQSSQNGRRQHLQE